ncbi:2-hydroxychromene-2-carboxylate isomerase [Roseovarius sp. 2305UL8-3]|uniref:2-hydroxychromene-2-carboxylate isomerase n=1 Tax=Roseovarius conchicola TaxID=3121636 RepID=UPI003528E402
MSRPRLEFWFEFASTYSYLSAMRLPTLAEATGVEVVWRPFLLGPIFAAQGWDTSPFNLYAAKGSYMWRDMERQAERYGLEFHRPDPFPQNSLRAARAAQLALQHPGGAAFCQNVFLAQFDAGQDISDPTVITACAAAAGLAGDALSGLETAENKHALRATTEEAARRGLFGAPSFLIGNELFWGNDRLEVALNWATHQE